MVSISDLIKVKKDFMSIFVVLDGSTVEQQQPFDIIDPRTAFVLRSIINKMRFDLLMKIKLYES